MGRRFGQHFLARESVLDYIATAACPDLEPLVLEIGPGRGALTRHLLKRAGHVVAIELDSALAAQLHARLPAVELIEQDVLAADLSRWGQLVIAGNLPYYITSPILDKVLSLGPLLKRAVFLVQAEVAERLIAQPGTRNYGYLTARTQIASKVELLSRVPPAAFHPPPKVDSAVVRLTPHSPAAVYFIEDPARFLNFAGLCFHQKRKNLRNNLASAYDRDLLDAQPEARLRAEQLSIPQLADLYRRLNGQAAPPDQKV